MSEHEGMFVENIREALRTYERFVLSSILSSFFLVVYALPDRPSKVSVGYGEVGTGWAFFIALVLYFFFSFAARYAIIRAEENAREIRTPDVRKALGLLPSLAADPRTGFRGAMLVVSPILILTSMSVEFFRSKEPLSARPWLGYVFFFLIVALTTYAVWERLRLLERALGGSGGVDPAA
jgi:hypothetical protein